MVSVPLVPTSGAQLVEIAAALESLDDENMPEGVVDAVRWLIGEYLGYKRLFEQPDPVSRRVAREFNPISGEPDIDAGESWDDEQCGDGRDMITNTGEWDHCSVDAKVNASVMMQCFDHLGIVLDRRLCELSRLTSESNEIAQGCVAASAKTLGELAGIESKLSEITEHTNETRDRVARNERKMVEALQQMENYVDTIHTDVINVNQLAKQNKERLDQPEIDEAAALIDRAVSGPNFEVANESNNFLKRLFGL